jgi:hypothetical protein
MDERERRELEEIWDRQRERDPAEQGRPNPQVKK